MVCGRQDWNHGRGLEGEGPGPDFLEQNCCDGWVDTQIRLVKWQLTCFNLKMATIRARVEIDKKRLDSGMYKGRAGGFPPGSDGARFE